MGNTPETPVNCEINTVSRLNNRHELTKNEHVDPLGSVVHYRIRAFAAATIHPFRHNNQERVNAL